MEDLLSDLSELGIELEPEQLERFQNNLKINKTFASIAKSTSLLRNKKGIYLLTHSLTYSLTHLLTYLLTYLLTHSLTYSLTHLLTHSLTHR